MASFTLTEVLQATKGEALVARQQEFSFVTTDTRKINPGALFIALSGERFDGHDFLQQAVQQGASGVVVNKKYPADCLAGLEVTVIGVSDTLSAYQDLAEAHRNRFNIPVIAVTGSNGKTTTKDLIAAVLGAKLSVLKTQANFNNEIGLPLTLLELNSKHQVAVVEMGMRGFGQISSLTKIARPTIGVVTNVGETHMELLGSIANIAKAKQELVDAIEDSGTVILNSDNSYVKAMAAAAKGEIIFFGCSAEGNVRASQICHKGAYTYFTCTYQENSQVMRLPMVGQHNVENALAAIACGLALGLDFAEIQVGLENFTATKMRLQFDTVGAYTVINDAYNASPASMQAALNTLAEVAEGRKIAVLGDMLELGTIAVKAHEQVGYLAAKAEVAAVVTVGELGAVIAQAAKQHGVATVVACTTHESAGQALEKILESGDTILFKGSRGMQMEKIIELLPQ